MVCQKELWVWSQIMLYCLEFSDSFPLEKMIMFGKGCQSSMAGPQVSFQTRWLEELCSPLGMLMLNQKGSRVSLVYVRL